MSETHERYMSDSMCHNLTDTILSFITRVKVSSTEVRQAAALACEIRELRRVSRTAALHAAQEVKINE